MKRKASPSTLEDNQTIKKLKPSDEETINKSEVNLEGFFMKLF
jgi:hypothetical protein